MKNNKANPIELARELCFSIYDSMEYKAFKKAEEDILNNDIVIGYLNNIEEAQEQHNNFMSTNAYNLEAILLKIQEVQNKEKVEDLIQNYFQAKKDYNKLLSNIYAIIEYMTGNFKLKSSDKGCCGKCHSDCSNCAK